MRAVDRDTGRELAGTVTVAATPWARARGLLGRRGLEPGEGLLLSPCRGVHTFFMRFPIDVIFLDRRNLVVEAARDLAPGRVAGIHLAARSALELPAGTVARCGAKPGHRVLLE